MSPQNVRIVFNDTKWYFTVCIDRYRSRTFDLASAAKARVYADVRLLQ